MGKGQILSGGENGQYSVKLLYNREKALAALDRINRWITSKEEQIAAIPSGDPQHKLPELKLALASLHKQKEYIESIPTDPTVSAWCADLTENLTGEVGTIEIAAGTDAVLVRPGYEGRSDYDSGRDGQMQHFKAMTPEQWFYNAAMAPGWKKWMPTYRVGTLSALNNDKCTVTLDAATTPIYRGGSVSIDVDQVLTDVDIEYMNCNGAAFKDGDRVVVEFRGQDFDSPWVIGFETDPKPCPNDVPIYAAYQDKKYVIFWNCENNTYSKNVFWSETFDGPKIYLTDDDYPFLIPDTGTDIFYQWKQTRQITSKEMYEVTYPEFTGNTIKQPVTTYKEFRLESPSGKVFLSGTRFVDHKEFYYFKSLSRTEYFTEENGNYEADDPEIHYTEFTRDGDCRVGTFSPYNPYPISAVMDGQWTGLYIDRPDTPACYHGAWTWGATQLIHVATEIKVKKIIHHTGDKTGAYGGNYTQDGQEIFERIFDRRVGPFRLVKPAGYINTGEDGGVYNLEYVRSPPDYWMKTQTHIYSMTGKMCPLGTVSWEFTIIHNYELDGLLVTGVVQSTACFDVEGYESGGGFCCENSPAGDLISIEKNGDSGPYAKGEIAIYNDDVTLQLYCYRNHDRNTLAQCAKRTSKTTPFGISRSAQLEEAVKQLITMAQREIVETEFTWNEYVTITTDGIYGPKTNQ